VSPQKRPDAGLFFVGTGNRIILQSGTSRSTALFAGGKSTALAVRIMETGPVEASIKQSIVKNGFPEKIVRLPFKALYDCCKKNDTGLNQVLKNLKAEDIIGEIQGNHVVFRSPGKPVPDRQQPAPDPAGGWDFSRLKEIANIENIQGLAQEHLAKLNPEQLAEIRKMAENMTAEQKAGILELFTRINKPKS